MDRQNTDAADDYLLSQFKSELEGAVAGTIDQEFIKGTVSGAKSTIDDMRREGNLSKSVITSFRLMELLADNWNLLKDGAFLDKVKAL